MPLARVAFQSCSFNHSDISPLRINNLQPQTDPMFADCVRPPNVGRNLRRLGAQNVVTRLSIRTGAVRPAHEHRDPQPKSPPRHFPR
jgi:hypothetical protein